MQMALKRRNEIQMALKWLFFGEKTQKSPGGSEYTLSGYSSSIIFFLFCVYGNVFSFSMSALLLTQINKQLNK